MEEKRRRTKCEANESREQEDEGNMVRDEFSETMPPSYEKSKTHRAFTRQPEGPNVPFEGPGLQKHHQNSTRRPPEREKKDTRRPQREKKDTRRPPEREKKSENGGGRGEKEARNFGPPTLRASTPPGHHPLGPHFFWVWPSPLLWALTPLGPTRLA